ncbi:nuclear transport factor 2 family protein [Streptomyces sp. NPDC048434]|uniref:nuclear transport factor 2 family protein n=1 Tax=Streptomyces sp. NPDC048434 TaxID=3365549 RepID=UPI003713FC14
MHDSQPQGITPDALPDVITRYLDAHRTHDTATAISAFHPDATVNDAGETHQGTSAIETWLTRSATEFTYTIELISAQEVDAQHYIATHHLEGNFPGGVVDLHYRFTLNCGLIEGLLIEP